MSVNRVFAGNSKNFLTSFSTAYRPWPRPAQPRSSPRRGAGLSQISVGTTRANWHIFGKTFFACLSPSATLPSAVFSSLTDRSSFQPETIRADASSAFQEPDRFRGAPFLFCCAVFVVRGKSTLSNTRELTAHLVVPSIALERWSICRASLY